MVNRQTLFIFLFITIITSSCRESLVDSRDAQSERELVGQWNLAFQTPSAPGSTQFYFYDDLTVRVVFEDPTDTTINFDEVFRYVVEDQYINYYKITTDGIGDIVGSNYIIELSRSKLVIDIQRSFGKIRQVYLKTS